MFTDCCCAIFLHRLTISSRHTMKLTARTPVLPSSHCRRDVENVGGTLAASRGREKVNGAPVFVAHGCCRVLLLLSIFSWRLSKFFSSHAAEVVEVPPLPASLFS